MKLNVDIKKLRKKYSLPSYMKKKAVDDFWSKAEKILNSHKRTHLAIGIYASQSYKYNVVLDNNIISDMIYNIRMRPGRWYFVDGYCINEGYGEREVFEEIAKNLFKILSASVNLDVATRPYE